jgi:hypothetical protein
MIRPQPKPERREKERKPLRRSSRLQAKRWGIKPRRARRLDTAQSNPAFLAWVHGESCCLAGPRCAGRIEAHHAGRKPGMALKAPDDTCVPLCTRHHDELTTHRGAFAGMSREALRALQDEWIAATYGRWLSHGARRTA